MTVSASLLEGEVKSLLATNCILGEGAFFDAKENYFRFVDIKAKRIFRYDLAHEKLSTFEAPEQVGFVFPTINNSLIIGLKSGIFRFDESHNSFEKLITVDAHHANNRLNDGTIGPDGALWFGTMDDGESAPNGAFYRFDGELTQIDNDIPITNGPCFSPCGNFLYTVDTLGKKIFVWEMVGGLPANKRLFADLNDQKGFADGPVCDSHGNVWIGLFFGWGIRVYSPNGELIDFIKMPVSNITKIAFGGADLQTVFVTTAKIGIDEIEAKKQNLAGNVFTFRTKVPGFEPNALRI